MYVHMNERVFTEEERAKMQKLIDTGHYQDLSSALTSGSLTPEREAALQEIVDQVRPSSEGFVSQYKDEGAKDPGLSPEREAEIQEKLIKEFSDWQARQEKEKSARARIDEVKADIAHLEEEEKTLEELVATGGVAKEVDTSDADYRAANIAPPKPPHRGRPKKTTP